MPNLEINFCGVTSPNPFWLASAPPTNSGYQIMKAFDAGWGGAVWKTMGIPTVNVSSRYGGVNYKGSRMVGLNNIELISDRKLADNLREIEQVKKYYPKHTIIGSIMVQSREEWHSIVRDVQNAGADILELNFGCPHGMCERGMGSAVGQDPEILELLTSWVKEVSKVPVIVKLTPNISDITESARAAKRGGADAISLINTVQSIVGVDIDRFIPYPIVDGKSSNGGYCGPAVKPIALNMVKNCALDPDVQIPISGIGGIETWRDTVEFILLGSTSVQVATSAMHYGFGIVREMKAGLEDYMISHNFNSISEFVGKALPNVSNWEGLNLKYQVRATIDPEKCIGCQLCYAACEDGAHQAIKLSDDKNDRTPQIIDDNCVGCNLCSLVCPVESCIVMKRVDEGNAFENWKERMDKDNVPTTFNDDRAGGEGHHVPTVHEAWEKRKN